jgi:hypothetical protein
MDPAFVLFFQPFLQTDDILLNLPFPRQGEQHAEFIASYPEYLAFRLIQLGKKGGDCVQQGIAFLMTPGVIGLLEVVHIYHNHRHIPLLMTQADHFLLECLTVAHFRLQVVIEFGFLYNHIIEQQGHGNGAKDVRLPLGRNLDEGGKQGQ